MHVYNTPRATLIARTRGRLTARLQHALACACVIAGGIADAQAQPILIHPGSPTTPRPIVVVPPAPIPAPPPTPAPAPIPSLVVYPGDGSTTWMNWSGMKNAYPAQMLPAAVPARACQSATACKVVTINVPAGTYWTGRWAYRPFASGVYLAGDTPALVKPTLTTEQGQDKVRFTLGNNNAQQSYAYVWIEVAAGQNNLFSDYASVDVQTGSAQLQSPPWTAFTGRVRIDEGQRPKSPAGVLINPSNKAVNVVSAPVTGGMVQAQFAPTNRYVLQNVNSNYCAAANNNDAPQGARVVQADCNTDVRGDRDWHVGKTFGNVTTLQVSSTGRCMDLPNETRDYGAGVVVGQCTAHDSQRWYWTPNPADNTYTVVNANSGYCLDIEGGSRGMYAKLTQTTCTGSASQKWRLYPNRSTWAQAEPLPREYSGNTVFAKVVLADGRVLIAGGSAPNRGGALRDAYLYNPVTNKWTAAGQTNIGHYHSPAVLLHDGRVLLVDSHRVNAEIYDPATNQWRLAAVPPVSTRPAAAVTLQDGRVFATDGTSYSLFSPANGSWSQPKSLGSNSQEAPSTTLLDNGKVLVAGSPGPGNAALYDPATDSTKLIARQESTAYHVATKLANGKVLLAGGYGNQSIVSTVDLFDPQSETFTRVASMPTTRAGTSYSAVAGFNGKVLVVDGYQPGQPNRGYVRSAVAYDPATNTWSNLPLPQQAGYWAGLNLNWANLLALPDGRFIAMGATPGTDDLPMLRTVEIFAP